MRKPTLRSAKKKAWGTFSRYIRLKATQDTGYARCVTCPPNSPLLPLENLQAGHFIPGRRAAILFDERGVHVQCYGCNVCKSGNQIEYHRFMERRYGLQRALEIREELLKAQQKNPQYRVADYQAITEIYKQKIEALINK